MIKLTLTLKRYLLCLAGVVVVAAFFLERQGVSYISDVNGSVWINSFTTLQSSMNVIAENDPMRVKFLMPSTATMVMTANHKNSSLKNDIAHCGGFNTTTHW